MPIDPNTTPSLSLGFDISTFLYLGIAALVAYHYRRTILWITLVVALFLATVITARSLNRIRKGLNLTQLQYAHIGPSTWAACAALLVCAVVLVHYYASSGQRRRLGTNRLKGKTLENPSGNRAQLLNEGKQQDLLTCSTCGRQLKSGSALYHHMLDHRKPVKAVGTASRAPASERKAASVVSTDKGGAKPSTLTDKKSSTVHQVPTNKTYSKSPTVPKESFEPLYRELKDDEIRLVELETSSDFMGTLRGDLKTVRLGTRPVYAALSYFWGEQHEQQKTEQIWLKGQKKAITRVLADALRQMRAHGKLSLWVDQLCLHQNTPEMGQQVRRMYAIYQGAVEVSVWLGKEDCQSDTVMERLRQNAALGVGTLDLATKQFLQRAYWNRLWVIQEIAAASASALWIYCGSLYAEWTSFERFISGTSGTPIQRGSTVASNIKAARTIVQIRQRRRNQQRLALLEALIQTSHCETREKKDHVYGLLGLVIDHDDYVREPVYENVTSAQMCIEMADHNMKQLPYKDIIFLAGNSSAAHLPSWCPDFLNMTNDQITRDLVSYISGTDDKKRLGLTGNKWSTTGSANGVSHWHNVEGHRLQVNGYRICFIHGIGNIAGESPSQQRYSFSTEKAGIRLPPKWAVMLAPSYAEISSVIGGSRARTSEQWKTYNKGATTIRGLCEMLFLYDPSFSKRAEELALVSTIFGRVYRTYLEARTNSAEALCVLEWIRQHKEFIVYGTRLRDWTNLEAHRDWGWHQLFTATVLSAAKFPAVTSSMYAVIKEGLRLAFSAEILAWVHPNAQLEDEIWLINGCSMLAVLRRQPQNGRPNLQYRLIGHAYIGYMMTGETWKHLQTGGGQCYAGIELI